MQTELKAIALAVRRWRKTHQSPMAQLPTELQRNVVRLLEANSWDEVCGTVGVNRSQLSIWRRSHRDHLQLKPRRFSRKRRPQPKVSSPRKLRRRRSNPPTDFIEVALPPSAPALDVELKLPTGIVVHARSGGDIDALAGFVTRLLAGTDNAT